MESVEDRLVKLGFSEYEAKAYMALLRESPVTGYKLAKLSGIPRSTIYEVVGRLISQGAAVTVRMEDINKYAPVPPMELLDRRRREREKLVDSLKEELAALVSIAAPEPVWNIEGYENIIAKAEVMIDQASSCIYLFLSPTPLPALRPGLQRAIRRGLRVTAYSSSDFDLPDGHVVNTFLPPAALNPVKGLSLILVVDRKKMLIAERLGEDRARGSWTCSPLIVFIAEHHLRTDLYLPRILTFLGDRARDLIREEDRELFARAMESHTA